MPVPASALFAFLNERPALQLVRHDVVHQGFLAVRYRMRELVHALQLEGEGDPVLTDRLRVLLAEWLTVPLAFANLRPSVLDFLGDVRSVERRWGHDVRQHLDAARSVLGALAMCDSPLRDLVGTVAGELDVQGAAWRVWCHRSAVSHFRSAIAAHGLSLGDGAFLHTLRDFRESAPFDVLLKVGPLRSRGWGAMPGAVLAAPRCARVVQIAWAGSGDEPGFGDDPLIAPFAPPARDTTEPPDEPPGGATWIGHAWQRVLVRHGAAHELRAADAFDADELSEVTARPRDERVHRARIVCVTNESGIAYAEGASILVFSPEADDAGAIASRRVADVDAENACFLVWPDLGDVSLGGHHAGDGTYAERWKAELRRRLDSEGEALLHRLRTAGVALRRLHQCVEHWCEPATTVIHAPQQRRHFEILMRVLGFPGVLGAEDPPAARGRWWRSAWREIANSRGEAIQVGMQEQEIIGDALADVLRGWLVELRTAGASGESFRWTIPPGQTLEGTVSFLRIHDVEPGFRVPDVALRVMTPLNHLERWRA